MPLELWLAFAAASLVVLLIPGPTILLVVSYGLGQGWRTAFPMACGVALGDFTAMTLSMVGLGALLATSATLFTALKWIGAAYLVWLGISLWRAGSRLDARARTTATPARRLLGHAWLVTTLNPKGLTFFLAFVPQFIDPAGNFLVQVLILEATFVGLAFANVLVYAFAAARAGRLVRNPRVVGTVNRVGGTLLIGAGATVAVSSH